MKYTPIKVKTWVNRRSIGRTTGKYTPIKVKTWVNRRSIGRTKGTDLYRALYRAGIEDIGRGHRDIGDRPLFFIFY